MKEKISINVILFPNFETLDVFGPVEVFGKLEDCEIKHLSQKGGVITNQDGISIVTNAFNQLDDELDILFIPGGLGTRIEVNNDAFIKELTLLSEKSRFVLTVCTGSALLAKTDLLNGRKATSNKRAFDWVQSISGKVQWVRKARWVVDGKYYTSSGVSAGIDMSLGFVSDIYGLDIARQIAFRIEYNWQEDNLLDNFSDQ